MPEIKQVGLSAIIISAALGVSSCSMIPMFDGSPVSDNMRYRSNDASIKALSIPPELSTPAFDDSYAINKPVDPAPVSVVQQSSNNDASVMNRGSSTQDLLDSQSAPVSAGATNSVAQAPSEPVPVQAQSAPAAETISSSASSGAPRTQVLMTKVKSGESALAVNAPLSNTWSRLGGMLKAVGFDVTRQQPAQGIYTVVYKGGPSSQERGFLSRLLDSVDGVSLKSDKNIKSTSPLKVGETYLVLLVGNANQQSFVGVRNSDGKPADPAVATHILGLLKGQYEL